MPPRRRSESARKKYPAKHIYFHIRYCHTVSRHAAEHLRCCSLEGNCRVSFYCQYVCRENLRRTSCSCRNSPDPLDCIRIFILGAARIFPHSLCGCSRWCIFLTVCTPPSNQTLPSCFSAHTRGHGVRVQFDV